MYSNIHTPTVTESNQSSIDFINQHQQQYLNPFLRLNDTGEIVFNSGSKTSRRRFQSLKNYVNGLFECYSRLIIIRLDLKYQSEFIPHTSLQQAQDDLSHLFSNMRHTSLFDDLAGYIWKREQGDLGGYHYHCIFFYANTQKWNDSYYGEEIGKYWQSVVTQGRGCYFNCNQAQYKAQYPDYALGSINYNEEHKRLALLNILAYFSKDEQSIQNSLSNTRDMGRAQLPELSLNRLGRPRIRAYS